MDNFSYCTPTRYIFGRDTEKETGRLTAETGCRRVMIVSGGSSARKSGLLDRVTASLDEAGISYVELTGIKPKPLPEVCPTTVTSGISGPGKPS